MAGKPADAFNGLLREVDNAAGADVEIDRNAGVGRGPGCQRGTEGRGAIGDNLVGAVEQFGLGGAGAGGVDRECRMTFWRKWSATWDARDWLSRASPTFAAASHIFLHSRTP
jgi:hypothetical protein